MSVRKRKWTAADGEVKFAWVVDFKDLVGARRLRTFHLKKEADRYATKVRAELLDAELKAKGPAEVAASPSHGSTNPQKDTEMNKAAITTPAAKAATDAAVASAMRDLDGDVLDLVHMVRIANNIAERMLNRPHKKEADVGVFHLDLDDRDGFLFSLGDVERRVCSLKRRYYAAWSGEAVQ